MPTNVVMPQMGESIAEGTIVRWIKKVGDNVDRDEPLFEISTDKVDAEIPSPGAGVLTEIKVKEGETVPVNSVVAVIGVAGSAASAPSTSAPGGASVGKPAVHIPAYKPGDRVEIVPMTIMRKKIAEHMVASAHTSPHVYSVYEVDFHRLAQLREKKKADYERGGAKLTYTALMAKVVVDALRAFPVVNASIDGDN